MGDSAPSTGEEAVASALAKARRFNVVNLGCKVNRVEADSMAAAMVAAGALPADLPDADVVVVNTCTVTGEADKKARKAVRHALRTAPCATVIVTGCGVAIDAGAYEALGERVVAIERAALSAILGELAPSRALRTGEGFRTRVGLKVQDGCDHACTYCIVHTARGKSRSVAHADVLAEAEPYLRRGVREIVLAGIDLGSYRDGAYGLADLVSDLVELADKHAGPGQAPARVRASSLEPMSVDDRFVGLLATLDGRLCRHVHLPLQSGSTKVLREMARPYSAQRFRELAEGLYERVPGLSLTTDIIVGFPGETEGDFAQTVELARACRFSKIHVFPYSKRAGTPAAARADQVPAAIATRRAAELRRVSDELRQADFARRAGSVEYALVETASALTESYHEIAAPEGAAEGSLVPVVLGVTAAAESPCDIEPTIS